MENPKLYLVHCGYYDSAILDAVFEFHVDFVVAAESFEDARAKVRTEPDFQKMKMHVDGVRLVEAARGHRVELRFDPTLEGQSKVISQRHRDLAPKKAEPATPTGNP